MKLIKKIGMKSPTNTSTYRKRYGLYLCPDCNGEFEMIISDVKSRNTLRCKSCGAKKAKTTHGFNKTKLHQVWISIKARCNNTSSSDYKYYGAKGVTICDEWDNNFLSFREWCISQNHKDGMHISRFGDVGNYEPSNCKVVTRKENIGERNILYANRNKKENK